MDRSRKPVLFQFLDTSILAVDTVEVALQTHVAKFIFLTNESMELQQQTTKSRKCFGKLKTLSMLKPFENGALH